VALAAWLIL